MLVYSILLFRSLPRGGGLMESPLVARWVNRDKQRGSGKVVL